MRCIEIKLWEEWERIYTKINRNMRCIEIRLKEKTNEQRTGINRNMRCIEISAILSQLLNSLQD